MSVLFIDSSYDISLGLLNEAGQWHDFRSFRGHRASHTLQAEAHKLLQGAQVNLKELKGVVSLAGPGFYTGLRLSEGFADVTSFFQIPHYSFYSYEIPSWLGEERGTWITKAYRGEYFLYDWDATGGRTKLLSTRELEVFTTAKPMYFHSETSLDERLLPLVASAKSTLDLLRTDPMKIFNHVLGAKLHRESYYFRAPEDEFRMNP